MTNNANEFSAKQEFFDVTRLSLVSVPNINEMISLLGMRK